MASSPRRPPPRKNRPAESRSAFRRLDPHVADELVLEVRPNVRGQIDARIPTAPLRGALGPIRLGVPALDEMLVRWSVTSIRRLDLTDDDTDTTGEWPARRSFFRVQFARNRTDIAEAIRTLAGRDDLVVSVERNQYRATRELPTAGSGGSAGWGLGAVGAPAAWARLGHRGLRSIRVAIVDTGCDRAHVALQHAWAPGGTIDVVDLRTDDAPAGWHWEGDFADPDGSDDVGHGTHVAGIIGSRDLTGSRAGVAPGCALLSIRALARLVHDSTGQVIGFGTAFDSAAGIIWAIEQGAQVINLGYALKIGSAPERLAIRRALKKGILVVAAMGNDGPDKTTSYPAGYAETMAVGAVDSQGQRWSGSQTGPHIDLAAPGVDIVSTRLNGGFEPLTGTSMACAFVSGVAALVRSARPDLPVTALRQILQETAQPTVSQPNEQTGWGVVNADAAVKAVLS